MPETALAPHLDAAVHDLYTAGITAHRGAFTPQWADRMREDIDAAFTEARGREGGAVGRGPHRYYVEIHPEQLRGFVELVDHPWVRGVCEAVLGPDYRIVELGFDVPLAGAVNQPWHRDFPMPDTTRDERRLTSLAFNLTAVDTREDMGPFEIAPGTQWDDDPAFGHGMFPARDAYPRYDALAERKYPKRGDISARSALTIHRGTANHSSDARPVLVLGVDAPGAGNEAQHDMAVTRAYWSSLPGRVRAHLHCPVVEELTPIVQKHTIEGLVMGDA
ncbi:Ectoine hydroxylase-related dioxygenase, phytanoyl-CoA dioxygenase (PhyH) family [Streptomyces sp. LamerLS-316]|uniref:phytanoyl-CoA dioxygenase family protein n=1 Tax=unclassified Streptomyces TaxID=2593676 RepID=UPI000823CC6C|nr:MULTISPECIES: phytanoyl-CoA dioxygenase family protein [unclassified Streptomyces]MYQ41019.1 phytanoyl-CoA dioxygenase [Streptomyces sp. SID4921]SCK07245.1 Ectoine hydroxylase-related dioxygenase, phytanoyl-CoA dioxygenase (PhyH) family [Streptomyces sp. LamerLS-316]